MGSDVLCAGPPLLPTDEVGFAICDEALARLCPMADSGAFSRDRKQRRARVEYLSRCPSAARQSDRSQPSGLELVLATLDEPEKYYCLVRAGLVDVGVLALPHLG